jgi:hypothetical protein
MFYSYIVRPRLLQWDPLTPRNKSNRHMSFALTKKSSRQKIERKAPLALLFEMCLLIYVLWNSSMELTSRHPAPEDHQSPSCL